MKALQYTAFGDSNVIQSNQVDKPSPQAGDVLIKVAATSINPMDMKFREGKLQQQMPIQLPYTPGLDVAGTVEAVGQDVKHINVGDQVMATAPTGGTYAEYVALPAGNVALSPANVSLPQAAALATGLVTAYTFLVETAQVKTGQRLLIQGAAGGVGSVMVQMAKALGAYVIGTATGAGIELDRSFGADEVIDYKSQDFTKLVQNVDTVVDLAGGETQSKSFQVLKPGGSLLSSVMPPDQEEAKKNQVTAKFVSSTSEPSQKKLEYGRQLVELDKIKPVISKTLSLDQAAQGQDMVSAGGINGKVVLVV